MAAPWDVLVRAAFARNGGVEQPRWGLIRDTGAIDAALADPARVPSILCNRWPGEVDTAQDVASRRRNR